MRILTLIDGHSRACLALKVARRINSLGVIEALADAMCLHGIPEHIRCDNGPEMISKALRKWVAKTGPQIQYIAPDSPWENGYCGSFNGKLRDECLHQGIFYSLKEVQAAIGLWQHTYNRVRPHSSLGYRPPAPATPLDLAHRYPLPPHCSSLSISPAQITGQVTLQQVVSARDLAAAVCQNCSRRPSSR
ncbi:transposase InsO family protein [Methylobacterium sp. RAS18]|nr:transposase InsO family protein [Methylobacterium sp. RAS18]